MDTMKRVGMRIVTTENVPFCKGTVPEGETGTLQRKSDFMFEIVFDKVYLMKRKPQYYYGLGIDTPLSDGFREVGAA